MGRSPPRCRARHRAIKLVTLYPGNGYIWPDVVGGQTLRASPVLLVTAPGATGKSLRQIGRKMLGVPLIDVAKMQVGQASLTGLLFNGLGYQRAPEYIPPFSPDLSPRHRWAR